MYLCSLHMMLYFIYFLYLFGNFLGNELYLLQIIGINMTMWSILYIKCQINKIKHIEAQLYRPFSRHPLFLFYCYNDPVFSRQNVKVVCLSDFCQFRNFVKLWNEDWRKDRSKLYGLGQQLAEDSCWLSLASGWNELSKYWYE